ncbi:MAG: cytochrome c [Phycisphaerales bacterium]|jgi:mono/diheme cytochrome c family protein|nr:cytochrome c [Phycisphaerales bacterium]
MSNLIKQIMDDLLKPFLADFKEMPAWIKWFGIVTSCVAIMILAIIFRARSEGVYNDKPRIHFIQNMDNQPKYVSQEANALFLDGRAMRPKIEGTVSQTEMTSDTHYFMGVVDEAWADSFPSAVTVDRDFLERGQDRYNIFCALCHGIGGLGDGVVHHRATQLVETGINGTTWVAPKNLHEDAIATQPVGQIYNSITNGVRTMAAYGSQIPVADRWAIVAYIKALQVSQNADASTVPNADSLPRVNEGSNP